MADSPIQFEGTVPNASGTPRGEVGGLAVFEGVMMRSRTGFAIAQRRADGAIVLTQFPYTSLTLRSKPWRLPFFRGAASLSEMMLIGTKALRYSAENAEGEEARKTRESTDARMTWLIVASLASMFGLLVVLPNLFLTGLVHLAGLVQWLDADGSGTFTEADHPFLFNILAGVVRVVILVVYILFLSMNDEIRRVFQYHGAEHKAVLALEEGRDVTVGRARLHDTLHPRCGTTFLALLALLSILGFAVGDVLLVQQVSGYPDWGFLSRKGVQLLMHLLMLPLLIGVTFEVIKFTSRRMRSRWARWILTPGFLLQRLTTRQPDDRQLEVAIIALFGALAIPPGHQPVESYVVRGLEDDETAPGFVPRTPARPAGTEAARTTVGTATEPGEVLP